MLGFVLQYSLTCSNLLHCISFYFFFSWHFDFFPVDYSRVAAVSYLLPAVFCVCSGRCTMFVRLVFARNLSYTTIVSSCSRAVLCSIDCLVHSSARGHVG